MKIIDIIKHSAELLALNGEIEILNSATVENESEILSNEEINRMLNLSALAIQEVCCNYVSVNEEIEITTENKEYALNKLKNYIRLNGIYKDGESVKFKIINRNIVFENDGTYIINFATYPEIKSLFDEIDFLTSLSPDVLVMGICSYYAIAKGMFKEFDIFHEQYIEKANSIKELAVFDLPLRRWE